MLNIFVDTNFFIQCKDKEQIPWNLLVSEDITVIIPITVSRQLDSFKTDGNRRRSGRARKVLPFIKELLNCSNIPIVSNGLTINFKMAERFPVGPPKNPILDLSETDDKIINELLAWHEKYSDEDVALLSDDTGVHLTCSQLEIKCLYIPKDWFLPQERDDIDREIQSLKDEIQKLKSDSPDIIIAQSDSNDSDEFNRKVLMYDELSDSSIEELTLRVKNRHQKVIDFSTKKTEEATFSSIFASHLSVAAFGTKEWRAPSESDIEKYNVEYEEWENSVYKFFANIPQKLNMYSKHNIISIDISNAGAMPAESAIVEFELLGDFIFSKINLRLEPFRTESQFKIPTPPKAPSGRFVSLLNTFALASRVSEDLVRPIQGLTNPYSLSRDPFSFYKRDTENNDRLKQFHIQEFRHETGDQFDLSISPQYTNKECKGILRCTVSAKNIKKSVSHDIKLKMSFMKGDIDRRAREIFSQVETVGWILDNENT